jgi:hypothetical protein
MDGAFTHDLDASGDVFGDGGVDEVTVLREGTLRKKAIGKR